MTESSTYLLRTVHPRSEKKKEWPESLSTPVFWEAEEEEDLRIHVSQKTYVLDQVKRSSSELRLEDIFGDVVRSYMETAQALRSVDLDPLAGSVELLEEQIHSAVGASRLETILVELERLATRAENALREAVVRSAPQQSGDADQELRRTLVAFAEAEGRRIPDRALEAAMFLCELVRSEVPNAPQPKFEAEGDGTKLRVSWGENLEWMVRPSEVMWPAVHIRAYTFEDGLPAGPPKTFRLAKSALDHAKGVLQSTT